MKEILKEVVFQAIEELGDHILGCVVFGGFARGKRGDIDVLVVVDNEESIERTKKLLEKLDENYDVHPTTLETFESRMFL